MYQLHAHVGYNLQMYIHDVYKNKFATLNPSGPKKMGLGLPYWR